jgi:hypothetical protein
VANRAGRRPEGLAATPVGQKGNGRARGCDMNIEERLEKIEHDVEVLRKEVRDLLQRFLKYVEDVEEDPVKD